MRIFQDQKAMHLFAEMIEILDKDDSKRFKDEVMNLFEKKSISEEGEYEEFRVTVGDLKQIENLLRINYKK